MNISTLKQIAAVSTFVVLAALPSTVSAENVDLGVLEPGTEYSWPQYCAVTGTYTPSESGTAKFVYSGSAPLALFSAADHNQDSEVKGSHSYSETGQVKTYTDLKAGSTYYLYSAYTMDAGTLIIYEGNPELKVISTTPSTDPASKEYYGGKLSASAFYEVLVNFNFPVTVGNTFLIAPDDTKVSVAAKGGGASVGCDIAPAMMQLYKEGKIKEGDEVTLRLLKVADANDPNNKFDGSGKCEVKFTVAAKPIELVEVIGADRKSVENVFYSYYLPGAENGLLKFVFDGELSSDKNSIASITYGNSDNLEIGIYSEDIAGTHDGNTAIYDFSGRLRRPIDMLPSSDSSTQPETLYVSCGNIFSPDGQRAYTGSKSNPTGFPVSYVINVLQYTVAGDFTPARGTDLVFGDPMEIWVMNGDKITYETIRFEYSENGEKKYYDMPEGDVKAAPDELSDNAILYTFNIPTLPCDEDTPVVVRMTGIQCADGLDHSNDVYGEFTRATSGVSDVEAVGNQTFDVYDIAGACILKNVNSQALRGLAKGIYVVNGKKIVIR